MIAPNTYHLHYMLQKPCKAKYYSKEKPEFLEEFLKQLFLFDSEI